MSEMVERFWALVNKRQSSECWNWLGRIQSNGSGINYGYFRAGKMRRAHRVAWEIANGGAIPNGLVIRHSCDNGICCNPAHLLAGTQKQNVQDRYDRGRAFHHRGSRHGNSKLIEADIPLIRQMAEQGYSQREIGRHFGVSQFPIKEILHRRLWRHV